MVNRVVIAALMILVLCLMACGQTPAKVNNSGHEAYLSGDYAAALDAYNLAQERSPDSGEPYYNSGNAIYRMGEYGDSLQSYDESLRHASGELRSRGFFNRGNGSFQQQQYAQAAQAYKEVLRMSPNDRDAKHNLELALKQLLPDEQEQDEQDQEEEQDEQQEEEQDDEQEQDQPITMEQARQILESVGESAQTLQERRGQVLVSPKPATEFDW